MTTNFDAFYAAAKSPGGHAAIQLSVQLVRQRAWFRVYKALNDRYPTSQAFATMLCSAEWLELAEEVALLVGLVAQGLDEAGEAPDAEQVVTALANVYPRGLDACADMAEQLGVEPEDLLSVLLYPSAVT